ncbi:MAG TPA: nitroreductase/quinone reductase family protein [Propionibacteriaceae bacterium]|nr:nitroreductase/quinone reductase family protein [Propionibacteriaceae bacterium]
MAVPKPLVRAGTAMSNGLYRVSGGRLMGKVRGIPVLLITVAGRKTGDKHTNPVLYLEDDGKYVVTGSGAGSTQEPQCLIASLRSARIALGIPPTSSSLADEKRVCSLLLSTAARDPGFKNLRRTDQAEIEVGRRHLPVSVEIAEGAEREVLWQRLLVRAPFFADYQKKVERQIPMAVLTPKT